MFVQSTAALLLATCLTPVQGLPRNVELCPSIGHYLLPDHSDCTKFYYCEYGYRRRDVSSCAPGTVFSVENQVCVHPSRSNCTLPKYPEQSNQANADEDRNYPFQLDDRFGSVTNIVIPIELNENGCPISKNVHILQPHETKCEWFYQCVHGRRVLMTCEHGSYFNPNKLICDLSSKVNCVNQSQQEDNENADDNDSESEENSFKPTDEIYINFENNNAEETDNNLGVADERDEVSINFENSNVNTNSEETNSLEGNNEEEKENDTIKLENGCPSDFSIHYTIPHETDCAKYYLCNLGKRILRRCGPGSWYDDKLLICTWPHLANCANSKTGNNERTLNKGWNQWRN